MPLVMGHFSPMQDLIQQITTQTAAIDSYVAQYQKAATAAGQHWTDIAGADKNEFDAAYTQYNTASQNMITALGGGVGKALMALQDANAYATQAVRGAASI